MYGIRTQDGSKIPTNKSGSNVYMFKEKHRAFMPAMRKTAIEIDDLLQEIMNQSGKYDLIVFRFTEEEIEDILIKKLMGY